MPTLTTTTKSAAGIGLYSAVIVTEDSGISVTIPILSPGQPITSDYIKSLDSAINTDGCTGVRDFYRECCVIHDLGYRYRIDPWGRVIGRADVDAGLRACIQAKSWLGKLSPVSWIRWSGVRIFGRYFYHPRVK